VHNGSQASRPSLVADFTYLNAVCEKYSKFFIYFNACTAHLCIVLSQPTIALLYIYITIFSLYIMFTPASFGTSVSSTGRSKT